MLLKGECSHILTHPHTYVTLLLFNTNSTSNDDVHRTHMIAFLALRDPTPWPNFRKPPPTSPASPPSLLPAPADEPPAALAAAAFPLPSFPFDGGGTPLESRLLFALDTFRCSTKSSFTLPESVERSVSALDTCATIRPVPLKLT